MTLDYVIKELTKELLWLIQNTSLEHRHTIVKQYLSMALTIGNNQKGLGRQKGVIEVDENDKILKYFKNQKLASMHYKVTIRTINRRINGHTIFPEHSNLKNNGKQFGNIRLKAIEL